MEGYEYWLCISLINAIETTWLVTLPHGRIVFVVVCSRSSVTQAAISFRIIATCASLDINPNSVPVIICRVIWYGSLFWFVTPDSHWSHWGARRPGSNPDRPKASPRLVWKSTKINLFSETVNIQRIYRPNCAILEVNLAGDFAYKYFFFRNYQRVKHWQSNEDLLVSFEL